VTGYTNSTNFPTSNPLQPTNHSFYNAFVAAIDPTGATLLYSTYLGGSGGDFGYGIAVDSADNAYVTGQTSSTDFPTSSPLQPTNHGGWDAFVAALDPTGATLLYSTYLGGSGDDHGQGIAVDNVGNAYVTGVTNSTDFPTANPLQPTYGGGFYDAFVAAIDPTGATLLYSTYLGGSSGDSGQGIAVDSFGDAYVTGHTLSTDFPTSNPLQPTNHGDYDAFVAALDPTGATLLYSTYLGGSSGDSGQGIAVDSFGDAYVTGHTFSTNFPTSNPLQPTNHGNTDAFVAALDPTGQTLLYSTYLGGSSYDEGYGIAVDSAGNAYVTGYTLSTDFPTSNPLQPTNHGSDDAFVAAIDATGATLLYSSYLGGGSDDIGRGIAVDSAGNAYVTGYTQSTDFPTSNPLQPTNHGIYDAFVAKIAP
jgi:Beta-propeller repeat